MILSIYLLFPAGLNAVETNKPWLVRFRGFNPAGIINV
jgi:hypothetical protein